MAIFRNELSEKDLDFVVETLAPGAKDREKLKECINQDPDIRRGSLGDERLFQKIMQDPPSISKISPLLFFEVLLRRTVKEMETATHTIDITVSMRIPVFDLNKTLDLLEEEEVFYYLVHLLTSFVSCEKKSFKDVSIDRLLEITKITEEEERFFVYKRIADTCLFVLGIFPKYLMYDYLYLFLKKKPPLTGEPKRSIADYEMLGQEFYALAAKQEIAKTGSLTNIFCLLSDNFYLAKKPLNLVSEKLAISH